MKSLSAHLQSRKREAGSASIAHKGSGWCTTIEARNRENPTCPFWIQLHDGQVNFMFQHDSDPVGSLREFGIQIPTEAGEPFWDPGLYCTIDFDNVDESEIERFVEQIIHSYFGIQESHELSSNLDKLK